MIRARTRRALLAASLAFLLPGLGHVYLRRWLRGAVWFGSLLVTSWVLWWTGAIPDAVVRTVENGGVVAAIRAGQALPFEATLSLLVVRGLNVLDAYVLARQPRETSDDAGSTRCPACGRELDADLDFCPWCTTRLTDENDESETDSATFR